MQDPASTGCTLSKACCGGRPEAEQHGPSLPASTTTGLPSACASLLLVPVTVSFVCLAFAFQLLKKTIHLFGSLSVFVLVLAASDPSPHHTTCLSYLSHRVSIWMAVMSMKLETVSSFPFLSAACMCVSFQLSFLRIHDHCADSCGNLFFFFSPSLLTSLISFVMG